MKGRVTIGLVGDRSDSVPAHLAIPLALENAAAVLGIEAAYEWVPTERIRSASRVAAFDGLWCVPASPYRSMDGALLAIRCAREGRIPFLGTCGGFQHADHRVRAQRARLAGRDSRRDRFDRGARRHLAAVVRTDSTAAARSNCSPVRASPRPTARTKTTEEYLCSYGVNPAFRASLIAGPLRETARDDTGDLRAVELDDHPFFVATLFQPERAALRGRPAPLVTAFLQACGAR